MHGRWLVGIVGALALTVCAIMAGERTLVGQGSGSPAKDTITTDVVYGHKAGMALTFDIYRPAMPNGSAVISVLSGGWRSTWETLQQFRDTPSGDFGFWPRKRFWNKAAFCRHTATVHSLIKGLRFSPSGTVAVRHSV